MSKLSNFLFSAVAASVLAIAPLQAHTAYGADLPACTIQGTASAETLTGTEGADVICTGGGNDVIFALGGDDVVIVQNGGTVNVDLGYGDDTFYGGISLTQYHAVIHGGEGDDLIDGGYASRWRAIPLVEHGTVRLTGAGPSLRPIASPRPATRRVPRSGSRAPLRPVWPRACSWGCDATSRACPCRHTRAAGCRFRHPLRPA